MFVFHRTIQPGFLFSIINQSGYSNQIINYTNQILEYVTLKSVFKEKKKNVNIALSRTFYV